MKNPLRKRLLRELKSEFGKYLVIFLLLAGTISLVSGFLVADGSLLIAYNEGFERYNIEDGNFRLGEKANKAQLKSIRDLGVTVYDLFYAEEALTNGSTLRIYPNREQVDLVCLMQGAMPTSDEIAIDRMYADNNSLTIGDTLESGARSWTVTGLVALPDYSCLFRDNNDSMFDAVKFGVAIVTPEMFEDFSKDELYWNYAWKYDVKPAEGKPEQDAAEDLMQGILNEAELENFIPTYQNQAIHRRRYGRRQGHDGNSFVYRHIDNGFRFRNHHQQYHFQGGQCHRYPAGLRLYEKRTDSTLYDHADHRDADQRPDR